MEIRFNRCPFCGSEDVTVKPVWKTYWFCACQRCRAGGPVCKTRGAAADAWNRRSSQQALDLGGAR